VLVSRGLSGFMARNMKMLGAEMDQEAEKKNRQKNQKDPKVK